VIKPESNAEERAEKPKETPESKSNMVVRPLFNYANDVAGMVVANPAQQIDQKFSLNKPWLADTESHHFICSEMSAMIEYIEFKNDTERPKYEMSDGGIGGAQGKGKCIIYLDQGSGVHKLIVDCLYNLKVSINLFSTSLSMHTHGIWHNTIQGTFLSMNSDETVGYTYQYNKLH
jgi:hypothetical protein